jgi:hypothetical protein
MPIQFSEPVDGKYHGEAVVLSGQVLHTKKLGQFSIDLPSLVYHRERLPVDYNHDHDLILGYADNFRVDDEMLVADVYLMEGIPKVQEIITLIKGGTPFEMSPSIKEEEGLLEHEDGINRYKHVPMRGVSICPFGTDRFTSLTLLNEDTMPKQQTQTTNLSEEKPSGESEASSVKDPSLAEFCEVYGLEKGCELYQSGADIEDIRTLKELIDKYGVPGPPEAEPTELTEDPLTKPSEEQDKETTELKAIVTELRAEITKLHAAIPRGEQPVKHNFQNEEPKKELSAKEEYLQGFTQSMKKK